MLLTIGKKSHKQWRRYIILISQSRCLKGMTWIVHVIILLKSKSSVSIRCVFSLKIQPRCSLNYRVVICARKFVVNTVNYSKNRSFEVPVILVKGGLIMLLKKKKKKARSRAK